MSQLIRFTLNGRPVEVEVDPQRSALRVLREDLGITTLKAGCAPQGSCGACTAIINDKPRLTCTIPIRALDGRRVLTHAGVDADEARIYEDAFVEAGGTQCGFCTPGIVMSTKALLDRDPDPSREAIDHALNIHLCRCTGYVKIRDSVKLAAERRRAELRAGRRAPAHTGVGSSWRPESARDAVMGRRSYLGDMRRPGMLHAVFVWTPSARCRIERVDTRAAAAMPGVVAVATARDLPGDHLVGLMRHDWRVMVDEGEETRCVNDVIAVVAAETLEQAEAAAAAVIIEATELVPVLDMDEAAEDMASFLSMSEVDKGDPDAAWERCAHVVEETFHSQVIDQAFLEPEAALVVPDPDGGLTLYSCNQGVFDDQRQLCALFSLPPERLRVVLVPTGGGFGAKEDLNVQAQTVLLARMTGRPVRTVLTMAESARMHPKRHAMRMRYKVGCDAEGRLVATEARIIGDTGGYASVGAKVLERAAGHACGPYSVPHVKVLAVAVYTNNPVAGAMRGFGVNQVAFAFEGCLDRLADRLGMDKLEFRMRNLLGPGDTWATGQVMDEGCAVKQTLEALRPHYARALAQGKHVGVACGIKNVGMGNAVVEVGRCELRVESATRVRLHTGFTEMGQGHDTVMAQMVAEASGLSAERFAVECSTHAAVQVGMTTASRATYLGGNAAKDAGQRLRTALDQVGGDLGALVDRVFQGEWTAPPTHKPEDGPGLIASGERPVTHYSFGYASQLAIVDAEGRLEELVAAHDVGRAINRVATEGQIEGGVFMGIGYALSEECVIDEGGWPTTKYGRLGILRARQMPRITTILVESPDPHGPWGAKGIGEIGLVPTAPAIAEACRSFDGVWRSRLPMRDTAAARAMGVRIPRRR